MSKNRIGAPPLKIDQLFSNLPYYHEKFQNYPTTVTIKKPEIGLKNRGIRDILYHIIWKKFIIFMKISNYCTSISRFYNKIKPSISSRNVHIIYQKYQYSKFHHNRSRCNIPIYKENLNFTVLSSHFRILIRWNLWKIFLFCLQNS